MAKYTNQFIIKVRADAQNMERKKVADKYHMTLGKINYIIDRAKVKHVDPPLKSKAEIPISVSKPMKSNLAELLKPAEFKENPKPETSSIIKFFKKIFGAD